MTEHTYKEHIFIALIILVGAMLRMYHLDEWPIFSDEINTIVESRNYEIGSDSGDRAHWTLVTNGLCHFLTGWSFSLFGESLASARLPSLLFGVLALPFFYLLIRRLFSREVAFLTVLYMAFSPNLIFLSGFARYNSMLFFFGGVSFLLLLIGFLENRLGFLCLGGVCSILAVLTHGTGCLVIAVFVLFAVGYSLSQRELRTRRLVTIALFFLPFCLLALVFQKELLWVVDVITRNFRGGQVGYSPARTVASVAYNNGVVHAIFAVYGLFLALRQKRARPLAMALYWVIPFASVILGGIWFQTGPRYLNSVLPGFYVLAALGTWQCLSGFSPKDRLARVFLVLFILASQGPLLVSDLIDGGRYDTASASRYLLECRAREPDLVCLAEGHMIYDYYGEGRLKVGELPSQLSGLLTELAGVRSALIVFPMQRGVPLGFVGKDYQNWLNENCKEVRTFGRNRFDFMRYEIVVYRYDAQESLLKSPDPGERLIR